MINSTPLFKPIRLSYRRIYILPTKRGLGFVLLITLLLLIALVYNNNLVYLLCFLLASLFFITILHTVNSLQGLLISKGKSADIFVGDEAKNILVVENLSAAARYSIQIGLTAKEARTIDLKAQQRSLVSLPQRVNKRGWFVIDKPVVSSCYPFGLFRAWHRLDIEIKTLVYPRPSLQVSPLPESFQSEGVQGHSQKGLEDFSGLQVYQSGDSIRQIHWRAYAKGQGLLTRQYSGDESSAIWLDYEQTLGSSQEERLSEMCRWVLDADNAGLEYGFSLAGLNIEPNRGNLHSKQCLQALALM